MQTNINFNRSCIHVKKNNLRMESIHAEVELWGTIGEAQSPHLISFGPLRDSDGIVLYYVSNPQVNERCSTEDLSHLIWNLQFKPDGTVDPAVLEQLGDKICVELIRNRRPSITA